MAVCFVRPQVCAMPAIRAPRRYVRLRAGLKPCEVHATETVHKAVGIVQEKIQRFDGAITRLITDDKGTRFLIAFGLPGHLHEDDEVSLLRAMRARIERGTRRQIKREIERTDQEHKHERGHSRKIGRTPTLGRATARYAERHSGSTGLSVTVHLCTQARAVLSALEVIESLRKVKGYAPEGEPQRMLDCAVGITTGRVFCGEAGSNNRREYTLSGNKVNLAARLMQV